MKWSGHFPFLFINRLKMTWDRQAYLWSDLDLRFVSFYKSNYIAEKMDAKRLQKHCTKPCSAKSRNNGNQYSINLHLCRCTVYSFTKLSMKPKCHLQAYYVKCRLAKWLRERTLLCYQLCSIMKVSYAHQACIYWIKNTEKTNIVKYYNLK